MNIWMEGEYVNKAGENVHSDICIEDKGKNVLVAFEIISEIIRLADMTKPWSVHSNGICPEHNHIKE